MTNMVPRSFASSATDQDAKWTTLGTTSSHQVVFQVTVVHGGRRPHNEWLSVEYRDSPSNITDVDAGTVVCPAA